MPDPTLADVLAALEREGCDTGDGEGPSNGTVELALSWLLSNRTALERMTLEQAALATVPEQYQSCSVVVTPNGSAAPKVASFSLSNGDHGYLIIVGANWKPEVGR